MAWQGSPSSYSWPIRDEANGYPSANGGLDYGAWKSPIFVDAGLGERIISIDAPSDAALVIASSTDWESNQAGSRGGQLMLPDSYAVTACEDRITQFPGMTLVRGPACVVIRVTDPATTKSSTASVPMYGGICH